MLGYLLECILTFFDTTYTVWCVYRFIVIYSMSSPHIFRVVRPSCGHRKQREGNTVNGPDSLSAEITMN